MASLHASVPANLQHACNTRLASVRCTHASGCTVPLLASLQQACALYSAGVLTTSVRTAPPAAAHTQVVDILKVEDLPKKAVFCRCWRSGTVRGTRNACRPAAAVEVQRHAAPAAAHPARACRAAARTVPQLRRVAHEAQQGARMRRNGQARAAAAQQQQRQCRCSSSTRCD